MAKIKMSSPWVVFYREINEMFKYDKQVHVVYDEDENHIKLYVDDDYKAEALSYLLPEEKCFGNVTLTISVIPANIDKDMSLVGVNRADLLEIALTDNGAFSFSKTIHGIFTNNLTYIVFKNKVVQYFVDDLSDIYGQCSTLYQEIAKDVFGEIEGVFFCTDIDDAYVDNVSERFGDRP